MKTFKFLMVALTLMMGMAFSSCLNSDDDDDNTLYTTALVKVCYSGGYYFKMADGSTITPSSSSLSAFSSSLSSIRGHVVCVYFSYTSAYVSGDGSDISNVTVNSIMDLTDAVEVVYEEGAANDSIEDAPILSLGNSNYTPTVFDEETFVLPLDYYAYTDYHSFTLVYYYDENNTSSDTIDLYLRHNTQGDNDKYTGSSTYETYYSYGAYYLEYWKLYLHGFNLDDIFGVLDSEPTSVRIHYKQNSSSIDLDDSNTTEKTYTLSLVD